MASLRKQATATSWVKWSQVQILPARPESNGL
jgi:hypothetical protein